MLQKALRVLAAIIGFVLLAGVVLYVASETGEVVVLRSRDPETGEVRDTRLWVVDHEGSPWLRAGNPTTRWFRDLEGKPKVVLMRGSDAFSMQALPTPEARDTINDLMNQKYGWADSVICFVMPRDKKVPVRLRPAVLE